MAGDILGELDVGGMGDAVSSWLGSGANKAVDPSKVSEALGNERVSEFADQAGVDTSEASTLLAACCPASSTSWVLTANCRTRAVNDRKISGLLGGLGR